MSSLVENNYSAYHQGTDPFKITALQTLRTKIELLEQLDVVEIGLQRSLKLRPTKSTAEKLGLVEELKRRVEASPNDIRIPFNLQSPPPIRSSCRGSLCVNQRPDQEVRLERQLTLALVSLSAEEDDYNNKFTSSASIDTMSSECSIAETKSFLAHGSEFTVISKSSVQPKENEPIDLFISGEERRLQPQPEEAPMITAPSVSILKSSLRNGRILVKHDDYGNDICDGCCTSGDLTHTNRIRNRSTKTVRFCQSSIRLIKEEPTIEDRLTEARRLISEARNSRDNFNVC